MKLAERLEDGFRYITAIEEVKASPKTIKGLWIVTRKLKDTEAGGVKYTMDYGIVKASEPYLFEKPTRSASAIAYEKQQMIKRIENQEVLYE